MDFYRELKEEIADYEGRHDDLIYLAPEFYRLLTTLLDDPRLTARLRAIVACGIAYFILPVDVIPEEIYGPYGYIDDIYMCAWVGKTVSEALGDAALVRHAWHGEGDIVAIIDEILAKQHELIAEDWPKIVQYVGVDALTR
jgi:uncharacterized membrane protein YkvA (DUF1232 family)